MKISMLLLITLACALFVFTFGAFYRAEESSADQALPRIHTLTQPDGSRFSARQRGDEWLHKWETMDGYTIVQNQQGYWTYAVQDETGWLAPSAIIVGTDPPAMRGISKHLGPTKTVLDKILSRIQVLRSQQRIVPSTGTINMPVLLVNFSDTPVTIPAADFDTLLFSTGTTSLTDYYQEVSYNQLNVSGDIIDWYTASKPHDYYGHDVYDPVRRDEHVGELIIEGVTAADPSFNFANYDADGDCYVDTLIVVHQGARQAETGNSYDIWAHQGGLEYCKLKKDGSGEITTDDSCLADPSKFIKINDYTIQSEILDVDGQQITIGVFAHEFGHALGLPDLYDTDYTSVGVGVWSLMDSGDKCRNSRSGDRPCHLDAWSKTKLGWVTPTQVNGTLTNETIEAAAATADVYQFLGGTPGESGEYFLVENRYQTGFDTDLPGSGLAIWHIDESMGDITLNNVNDHECYPPKDCSTTHYRVSLEQADGQWDLEKNVNFGDDGDLYTSTSIAASFSDSTTPSSKLYRNFSTTIEITNISASGPSMTADLSVTFLDPAFDTDGKITTDFDSRPDVAYAVALQADGKIVAAGYATTDAMENVVLARYLPDGTLDTTFGPDNTGKVITNFANAYERAHAVAIAANGDILTAGDSYTGTDINYDFAVVRYDSDGNELWKVTTDFDNNNDRGNAIAIQSDGKIVVAGKAIVSNTARFAVARYHADGSLDSTFSGGKVTTGFYIGRGAQGDAMLIDHEGKIVVAGHTSTSSAGHDFALVRFNQNGTLDQSFGTGGKVVTPVSSDHDDALAVALDADHRIVAAGSTWRLSSVTDFALARYHPNGELDTTFGLGGTRVTDVHGKWDNARAVAIRPDGKIVAAGDAYITTDIDFAVACYTANGTLDIMFGTDGIITTDIAGSTDRGYAIALQPDGNIVVAGSADTGTLSDFALARYLAQPAVPPPAAKLDTPSGTTSYTQPLYMWLTESHDITAYRLKIDEQGGSNLLDTWYTPEKARCADDDLPDLCVLNPGISLTVGSSYSWWVQTRAGALDGPLSARKDFIVTTATPTPTPTPTPTSTPASTPTPPPTPTIPPTPTPTIPPPANDQLSLAISLSGNTGSMSGTNVGATAENGEAHESPYASPPYQTVWWTWTAPENGITVFDTFESDFDTTLGIYTGNAITNLTPVAGNDNASGSTLQSQVDVPVQAGQTYRIVVDGTGNTTGQITLHWQWQAANPSCGGTNAVLNGVIYDGETMQCRAANAIYLLPGFHAEEGSEFRAYIGEE